MKKTTLYPTHCPPQTTEPASAGNQKTEIDLAAARALLNSLPDEEVENQLGAIGCVMMVHYDAMSTIFNAHGIQVSFREEMGLLALLILSAKNTAGARDSAHDYFKILAKNGPKHDVQ